MSTALLCRGLLAAGLIGAASGALAQPRYSIEWLSDLPGGAALSQGMSINQLGTVGGQSVSADGHLATLWAGPARTPASLGDLPGGSVSSMVYAINDRGTTAGTANNGQLRGFRRLADGAMLELPDLPGGSDASGAYGLNNADVAVGYGYSATSGSNPVALLWAPGAAPLVLGDLPGGSYQSSARAINDAGVVVGSSFDASGRRAFVWTAADGMQALPDLPGGSSTGEAYAINAAGWIVGYSYAGVGGNGNAMHAALWRDGQVFDLGAGSTPSQAMGINALGQVVGTSNYRAALWRDGQFADLNGLVDGLPFGSVLMTATSINDAGQITGWASGADGQRVGFVLTEVGAVPEPGGWALMLAGALATVRLARRRRPNRR